MQNLTVKQQRDILLKCVQEIGRICDNTNSTHEGIWRIVYATLQECGEDMTPTSEEQLATPAVVGQSEQLFCPCCKSKNIYEGDRMNYCRVCEYNWAK